MIENNSFVDLFNLSQDDIENIIESLIKNHKLDTAFNVYVRAYNFPLDIAYNAVMALDEYYSSED